MRLFTLCLVVAGLLLGSTTYAIKKKCHTGYLGTEICDGLDVRRNMRKAVDLPALSAQERRMLKAQERQPGRGGSGYGHIYGFGDDAVTVPRRVASAQGVQTPPSVCEYRGLFTKNGVLISWHEQRAEEEMALDRCEHERREVQATAEAEYNKLMAIWLPCATDVGKIARINFKTDEERDRAVRDKCGTEPQRPKEPERCTNFWSGFETAGKYDPRWVYLRHIEQWEVCVYKQVKKARQLCLAGTAIGDVGVDAEIIRMCGDEPARPVIDGGTPSPATPKR